MNQESTEVIEILKEAKAKIANSSNNTEVYSVVEEFLEKIFDSECAEFYLFDFDKQIFFSDKRDALSITHLKGILGYTISIQKPSFYNHVVSEKNYIAQIDNPMDIKLKSQMIVPIIENNHLISFFRVSKNINHTNQYTIQNLQLASSINHFFIDVSRIILENRVDKNINLDEDNRKIINIERNTPSDEINSAMLFLANVVHDIRTPVNSLYGFLELLEYEISDKRLKGYIANAKDSAKFISTLTDSILEQTKQNHEIQISEDITVNTIKYFAKIANIFTANMTDKGISYIVYLDPKMPKEIKLNELKLKRVIINLIGNAYKFTPAGKAILFSIDFDAQNRLFNISISDTGIGIAQNKQKEIFEAFAQAEDDTSVHFGGTGLGLSISAKYVDSLGGKLELESQIDKGSKFYFSIPLEITCDKPTISDFFHKNRVVTILNKNPNDLDTLNMKRYLLELGLADEAVTISNKPQDNTTNLICFENSITDELLSNISNYKKIIFVEDKLLSLFSNPQFTNQNIISQNSFYSEDMRNMLYYRRQKRILIIDDNKINILLLTSMMESENVDITSIIDSRRGLSTLTDAHENGNDFDILFIDDQMPNVSGTEIVTQYREYEKNNNIKPLLMVSISGNPILGDEIKSQYDLILGKPFGKQAVQDALAQLGK